MGYQADSDIIRFILPCSELGNLELVELGEISQKRFFCCILLKYAKTQLMFKCLENTNKTRTREHLMGNPVQGGPSRLGPGLG